MKHLTDSQLNEYFDEALDAQARRAVDAHLQSCAECRARLEELQQVFSDLADLSEIKLPHDLTSSIMAHLPSKQPRIWTPFFAAQLGAALGLFFWLLTQTINFIIPIVSTFQVSQLAMPSLQFAIPNFQFPNFYAPFSIFISLFSVPKFPLPIFNLPTFQPSTLNLSPFSFAFIVTSVFLLWLIGNLSLLRNRTGVQK